MSEETQTAETAAYPKLKAAYHLLTEEARNEAFESIMAIVATKSRPVNQIYLRQVMSGLRTHPCSEEVAKVISQYFRGLGMNISVQDVRDCVSVVSQ